MRQEGGPAFCQGGEGGGAGAGGEQGGGGLAAPEDSVTGRELVKCSWTRVV